MMETGSWENLLSLDLNTCDSLSDESLSEFLELVGPQLQGLVVGGIPPLLESFWLTNIPRLKRIKYNHRNSVDTYIDKHNHIDSKRKTKHCFTHEKKFFVKK